MSRFSIEKILSRSAETFRRGTLQFFIKFGIENVWMRCWGGGSAKIFRRNFHVSQS